MVKLDSIFTCEPLMDKANNLLQLCPKEANLDETNLVQNSINEMIRFGFLQKVPSRR